MNQNPYESPQATGHEFGKPSRLARVLLVLGIVCCLVSWSTSLFPAFGPTINRIDGLRNLLLVYFWVEFYAAVIGPVFTGIAMWKGSGVIRVSAVLVLLVQSPVSLAAVLWMLKS
jgi:hypothetical protein